MWKAQSSFKRSFRGLPSRGRKYEARNASFCCTKKKGSGEPQTWSKIPPPPLCRPLKHSMNLGGVGWVFSRSALSNNYPRLHPWPVLVFVDFGDRFLPLISRRIFGALGSFETRRVLGHAHGDLRALDWCSEADTRMDSCKLLRWPFCMDCPHPWQSAEEVNVRCWNCPPLLRVGGLGWQWGRCAVFAQAGVDCCFLYARTH